LRTVITGGAGFIGQALARQVLNHCEAQDELVLIDSLARHGKHQGVEELASHPCVNFVQADLSDAESVACIPLPVDRVYHLAARVGVGPVTRSPADVLKVNTLAAMNVFDWFCSSACPGARLLFASTSEVYSGNLMVGMDTPVPTPESVPLVISDLKNPRFSYALSKLWGEGYANYLSAEAGAFIATVRYHNIFGPQMGYDHVIPQIVKRIKSRENPFHLIGTDQTRAFCWIGDAAKATYLTMEASNLKAGDLIHIGNQNEEIQIGRLYRMLFDLCAWSPEVCETISAPPGSVSRRCPDVTALRALTGYEPSTPLLDGLKETVNWYLGDDK
jgi:nucleoside-diphosphate-sugar epimerase